MSISISDIAQLDGKIKAILSYFYECVEYTETYSTFHKDACMDSKFKNFIRFASEYPYIISHMIEEDILEISRCDVKHQTYLKLSSRYRRDANLKKLTQDVDSNIR